MAELEIKHYISHLQNVILTVLITIPQQIASGETLAIQHFQTATVF